MPTLIQIQRKIGDGEYALLDEVSDSGNYIDETIPPTCGTVTYRIRRYIDDEWTEWGDEVSIELLPYTLTYDNEYKVLSEPSITKSLDYKCKSLQVIQKQLNYTVYRQISIPISYKANKSYSTTKSLAYKAKPSFTITKELQYKVYRLYTTGISYSVDYSYSKQLSLAYNVTGKQYLYKIVDGVASLLADVTGLDEYIDESDFEDREIYRYQIVYTLIDSNNNERLYNLSNVAEVEYHHTYDLPVSLEYKVNYTYSVSTSIQYAVIAIDIYRRVDGGEWTLIDTIPFQTTEYVDTGEHSNNSTYDYKLYFTAYAPTESATRGESLYDASVTYEELNWIPLILSYGVVTPNSTSLDISYDVIPIIIKPIPIEYSINRSYELSIDIGYIVGIPSIIDIGSEYSVIKPYYQCADVSYAVISDKYKELVLSYDVSSVAVSHELPLSLQYSCVTSGSINLALEYIVPESHTISYGLTYSIINNYTINSPIDYSVIISSLLYIPTQYDISIPHEISTPVEYSVLSQGIIPTELIYSTLLNQDTSSELNYNVLTYRDEQIPINYNALTEHITQVDIQYNAYITVLHEYCLVYAVPSFHEFTIKMRYCVCVPWYERISLTSTITKEISLQSLITTNYSYDGAITLSVNLKSIMGD